VILAKTVKGYGLGETAQGRMGAHQAKKLDEGELMKIRNLFNVPISDRGRSQHRLPPGPPEDSPEMKYLRERERAMGGRLPVRHVKPIQITAPPLEIFKDLLAGFGDRVASTTSAFVAVLKSLMKHPELGKTDRAHRPRRSPHVRNGLAVRASSAFTPATASSTSPWTPTFCCIYKEAQNGQVLEEGITEAGSMASCLAAGTAYANYGVPTIPFFIYYSMFGFQRVGDLIWAFADSRGKGFLMGGTAGAPLCWAKAAAPGRPQSVVASTCPRVRFTIRLTPMSWP